MRLNSGGAKSVDDLGFTSPFPGRYHVVVKSVDESFEKFQNSVVVEFEALSGTTPGQQGRCHREFLSTNENALDRLRRFAVAAGIYRLDEGERDVRFAEAVGKQLVIQLDDHVYQGKTRRQIPFVGFWPLDHKEVADVPKDAEALKVHAAGGRVGLEPATEAAASGGATAAAGQPATGGKAEPHALGWDNL